MRYYKSNMTEKTLSVSISAIATQITLSDVLSLPSYPFTLVLDPDTASEEIVTATSLASGNIINVTRGEDGSSAQAHSAGAKIKHMVTARDLQEPQNHIAATTGVHGITGALADASTVTSHTSATAAHGATGAVVGTTNTQTLYNKTLPDYDLKITYASPIGQVVAYAGTSAPPSWLLCDGSTFSSNLYPSLASILGDRYGTHSGTTYYLPDFRSKFLRGSAATGTLSGTSGGSATHTHSGVTGASTGTVTVSTAGSTTVQSSAHTHTISSDNNIPPYFDVNYIIKAA